MMFAETTEHLKRLKRKVLEGGQVTREEAFSLLGEDLDPLCEAADEIRRHFCGNAFDLCTIANGKSGRCSEDCKYCAQSAHFSSAVEEYPLLPEGAFLADARRSREKGILRYSVVTSGKALPQDELERMCGVYRTAAAACGMSLCASHGLLSYKQFRMLKEAGVERYHNNLETSRRFFPRVCTTHTYGEKIEAIRAAQRAGLTVCSGGIMGLGESMADRIDMALELRTLGIRSVPVNLLNPIAGTPLFGTPVLGAADLRMTVAVFRFILPDAALRLAGGRGLLPDKGESAFLSGANAAITGDMLTTSGIDVERDLRMIASLGYEVRRI